MRSAQGYSYYILRSDSMSTTSTKTAATTATPGYFSRKIGNTTFMVSVSFSEKTKESMDDKILRLIVSDIQQGVEQKCS